MYMACPSMYTHVHVPHIQKLWEFPSKKICASSLFIHIQMYLMYVKIKHISMVSFKRL